MPENSHRESERKTVLLTGASSGIGRTCALHLDQLGFHVFAGVRNEDDGEALRQLATGIEPVLIDVTKPDTVESARQHIAEVAGPAGLAGLVNNAGAFAGGPMEFVARDDVRHLFDVNFFGVITVTQALLPLLRTARGRIVNMSSVSGLIAFPFFGPYAASKYALEAISDSLRVELRPWGISVILIEPGLVDTPFLDKAMDGLREARERFPPEAHDLYGPVFGHMEEHSKKHDSRGVPPERVAETVARVLMSKRPKPRYLVGKDTLGISIFRKLPARWRDWLIARHLPPCGQSR